MPSVDTIRNLTIRGNSQGLDKLATDLNNVAAAEKRVEQSSATMATVTDISTKRQLSATTQLERLAAQHDVTYRAQQQHARGMAVLERATAQGLSGTKEFAIAQTAVNKLHEEAAGKMGLNRMQLMETGHVVKSLADSIMAGASPMRAFLMEGGRIGQIFTEGQGGVGGTLKAVGSIIGNLATGWIGLSAGMATVGIAAGAMALAYENAQEKMQRSLEGTGRAAGMSVAQLSAAAADGARVGGIQSGQARDLAAGFAGVGLNQSQTASLVADSKRYGSFTGLGTDDAGKALAAAFGDPTRGLSDLDKSLGFVNDRLRQNITNMEASGNLEATRNIEMDAFNKALQATTDNTWGFSKWMSHEWDVFKQDNYRIGGAIDRTVFGSHAGLDKTPEEIAAAKRDADTNALSNQAGPIVRAILPDLVRAQDAANNLNVLRSALSDPMVLSKMGQSAGQVSQAFGNLTVQSANADPMKRMAQDYKLAMDAADAFSVAEKGAIDARRAELQVLRDTGDVSRAAAAAQMAMNEAVAKANSDAKDRLETAKQEAAMVGMTSYQRGRQQIVNEFEGYGGLLSKDAASKSEISDAMAPVKADLKSAGEQIAAALRDVARTISPTSSPAAGPYGTLNRGAFGGAALAQAPANIQAMIADAATRTNIDPNIIAAIGQKENGYRLTGGTSMLGADGRPSTAYGFGQLTNGAAADVAKAVPGFSKYDPNTAVFGSAEYLKLLVARNGGDMTAALNGYGGTQDYASDIARRAAGGARPMTIRGGTPTIAPVASTSIGSDTQAEGVKLRAYDQSAVDAPITAANNALVAQRAALEASVATWGMSASATATAAEKQKLLTGYEQEQIPVTDALRARIDATAQGYGDLAKASEDARKRQQDLVGAMDDVRSLASGGLGSFTSDLISGKSAAVGLHDALGSITNKLAGMAESGFLDMLFGKTGSPGGGILGSGIASIFSGGLPKFASGTDYAPGGPSLVGEQGPEIVSLPQGAQVTPNDQLGGGGDTTNHYHIDARGAQVGVAEQIATAIAQNNTRLPGMMQDLQTRTG